MSAFMFDIFTRLPSRFYSPLSFYASMAKNVNVKITRAAYKTNVAIKGGKCVGNQKFYVAARETYD